MQKVLRLSYMQIYNYAADGGADQRCLRGPGIRIHRGVNNTMHLLHLYGSAGSGVPARFCPSAVDLITIYFKSGWYKVQFVNDANGRHYQIIIIKITVLYN